MPRKDELVSRWMKISRSVALKEVAKHHMSFDCGEQSSAAFGEISRAGLASMQTNRTLVVGCENFRLRRNPIFVIGKTFPLKELLERLGV